MEIVNKKIKGLKAARNCIKDMDGLYYQIALNVKTGEVTVMGGWVSDNSWFEVDENEITIAITNKSLTMAEIKECALEAWECHKRIEKIILDN